LPVVAIPHPLLGMGDREVASLARKAVEQAVHVLTTPPARLTSEYTGWYEIVGDISVACDEAGCMPMYFAKRR